ncbi:MAG: type IV pilin-like G/H family protein [Cyanobacteria bacterium P01_A01_bin.17]
MAYLFNHSRVILRVAVSFCGVMVVGCSWFGDSSQPPVSTTESGTTPSPAASELPGGEPSGGEPTPSTAKVDQPSTGAETPTIEPATNEPSPLPKEEQQVVSQAVKDAEKQGNIARQDTGKTYLDNILLLQQTERFVGGTFVPNLAQLSDEVPKETTEYQFKVLRADTKEAVVVAIAKIPGITSYVGAAYSIEGSTPISGICRSNLPAQQAPKPPKLAGKSIQCASGSTAVE